MESYSFRESLRMVNSRPSKIRPSDLDEALVLMRDLIQGIPKDELDADGLIDEELVETITALHIAVFAEWGDISFRSKLHLLIGYYTQCSTEDLAPRESDLILDLVYSNIELLPPSSDEAPTLVPPPKDYSDAPDSNTPSSRPTARYNTPKIKH